MYMGYFLKIRMSYSVTVASQCSINYLGMVVVHIRDREFDHGEPVKDWEAPLPNDSKF